MTAKITQVFNKEKRNSALLLMNKKSEVSLFFSVPSKGTQSLKASTAVEAAACCCAVSMLMTICSKF